jgi:hypothetical protein
MCWSIVDIGEQIVADHRIDVNNLLVVNEMLHLLGMIMVVRLHQTIVSTGVHFWAWRR